MSDLSKTVQFLALLSISFQYFSVCFKVLRGKNPIVNSVENTLKCIAKEGTIPPEIRTACKSKTSLLFSSNVLVIDISTGHSALRWNKQSNHREMLPVLLQERNQRDSSIKRLEL